MCGGFTISELAGRASMIHLKLPFFLAEKHDYFTNANVCHPNKSEFQNQTNKLAIKSAFSFKHYIKIRVDGNQFGILISHTTLMITPQNKKVLRWQTILKTKAIV